MVSNQSQPMSIKVEKHGALSTTGLPSGPRHPSAVRGRVSLPLYGTSLQGWKAPDMSYWSVRDGAITGQSTAAHPCRTNQFIVWQGGDVTDFELKVKFRVTGNGQNSGVQFAASSGRMVRPLATRRTFTRAAATSAASATKCTSAKARTLTAKPLQ